MAQQFLPLQMQQAPNQMQAPMQSNLTYQQNQQHQTAYSMFPMQQQSQAPPFIQAPL